MGEHSSEHFLPQDLTQHEDDWREEWKRWESEEKAREEKTRDESRRSLEA